MRSTNCRVRWIALLVFGLLLSGYVLTREDSGTVATSAEDKEAISRISELMRTMRYTEATVRLLKSEPKKIFEIVSYEKPPANRLAAEAARRECAYLIDTAYQHMGYLGAKVKPIEFGPKKKVFEVDPGVQYCFNVFSVIGLKHFPLNELLPPKLGDVYSATAVNKWIASVRQKYLDAGASVAIVRQLARFDHEHHLVSVTIEFREQT